MERKTGDNKSSRRPPKEDLLTLEWCISQTQFGATAARPPVASDPGGDFKAEGGEALQLHPELGSANDSVQAMRVSVERMDGWNGGKQTEGRISWCCAGGRHVTLAAFY